MDAEMQALIAKYWGADFEARSERVLELSRRLVAAAEAAGWPPDSIPLAHLRMCVLHALHMTRVHSGRSAAEAMANLSLPCREEETLVSLVCEAVCARLDAGTLLTLPPSERAFEDAWDAAFAFAWHRADKTLRAERLAPIALHALG